ncbi:hypothetical protein [Flavobacterium sp.]|uniref:hypothetical protein n=1 Tax=Flavobacterium sp. TaxID=239 RepID=UPI0038FC06C2
MLNNTNGLRSIIESLMTASQINEAIQTITASNITFNTTGIALSFAAGGLQSGTMSGNATIASITGGSNGNKLSLWIKGHASIDYTLKCGLATPTDSLIDMVTTGKIITAGKIWILTFQNVNGGWKITGLTGGF